MSRTLFNLHSEYTTKKEALEEVGDFKIEGKDCFCREGQVIHTVKYEGDLVLLVKKKQRYEAWLIN